MEAKERITEIINKNLPKVKKIQLYISQKPEWGDFSSNILLSDKIKGPAKNKIVADLKKDEFVEKVGLAGPGFLNIFLSQKGLESIINAILAKKENYGRGRKKKERIQVEYISANPTGPLTLGNGRGAFGGETLARVYQFLGYQVEREYYINNLGRQIKILGASILSARKERFQGKEYQKFRKEELYQGKYITEVARKIEIDKGDSLLEIGQKAADQIIKEYIRPSVRRLGIRFDHWVKEDSLYNQGQVEKALDELKRKGLIYQKKGATWFKATQFGDEKDRVIKRGNGGYTYLASDIGYAYDKFKKRKFDRVVNLWGADHHGYVDRFKGVLQAFGWAKKWQVIIFQLVRLLKQGRAYRMSKREGVYHLLADLTKEVNPDVIKFVFLSKDFNTPLDIDLARLKAESKDNPVFYLQYAFARISSLERKKGRIKPEGENSNSEYVFNQEERDLILQLSRFPEIVEKIGQGLEVHLLAWYVNLVAKRFHRFYKSSPILKSPDKTRRKRWLVVQATKYVLKNSLELMNITHPEKM